MELIPSITPSNVPNIVPSNVPSIIPATVPSIIPTDVFPITFLPSTIPSIVDVPVTEDVFSTVLTPPYPFFPPLGGGGSGRYGDGYSRYKKPKFFASPTLVAFELGIFGKGIESGSGFEVIRPIPFGRVTRQRRYREPSLRSQFNMPFKLTI